jgi:hypothetical protein
VFNALTPADVRLIRRWIDEGAKTPSCRSLPTGDAGVGDAATDATTDATTSDAVSDSKGDAPDGG